MPISSEVRKAGPFAGNDITTAFPFTFRVFSSADVLVVRADALGVESELDEVTDYTVSLNANQNANPGGTVTLNAALATDTVLAITSRVQNLQPVDLTNSGGFYPAVITQALDRMVIMTQQLAERMDRAAVLPITSSADAEDLVSGILVVSAQAAALSAVAGSIAAVVAVSGVTTEVQDLAAITSDIQSLGPRASDIETLAAQAAAIATVAANMAAVLAADDNAAAAAASAGEAAISAAAAATFNPALYVQNSGGIASNLTVSGLTLATHVTEAVFAITGTTPAISPSNGPIQTWTLTGNSTPTITIANGRSVTLMIDDGTAYTITWPTIRWIGSGGLPPVLSATGYNVVHLFAVGGDIFGMFSGAG